MFRNVRSAKKWCALIIPVLVKVVRATSAQNIFTNATFAEKLSVLSAPHNVMIVEISFVKNMPQKCSHVPNVEKCTVHYATQDREYVGRVEKGQGSK
jgi:hypothetical protein